MLFLYILFPLAITKYLCILDLLLTLGKLYNVGMAVSMLHGRKPRFRICSGHFQVSRSVIKSILAPQAHICLLKLSMPAQPQLDINIYHPHLPSSSASRMTWLAPPIALQSDSLLTASLDLLIESTTPREQSFHLGLYLFWMLDLLDAFDWGGMVGTGMITQHIRWLLATRAVHMAAPVWATPTLVQI